jgi:hypothetical protein
MADQGDEPPKDFDRMSLGSLKRELEVQKSKTESAREEARERMRAQEQKAKAFPWGTIAGVVIVGIGVFFGAAYALRESFPNMAGAVLPIFIYHPADTGPPAVFPDAAHVAHDAGVDAPHHVAHHPHATTTTGGSGGGDLGLGDLGGGSDPIEGVGSGSR